MTTDPFPSRGVNPTGSLYLLIAVVADVVLLALWHTKVVEGPIILGAHLSLALGVFLFPSWRAHPAEAVMSSLSILVMGPLGAVGALVLRSAGRHARDGHGTDAEAGTRQPSPALTRSIATISEGRSIGRLNGAPESFAGLIANGDLADKQSLLGLISQRYTPDHLSTLRLALNSEEAPVRVSAAAVYAKLKEVNRLKMRNAGSGDNRTGAVARARDLANAARSGLLDEADAEDARQRAIDLLVGLRPVATVPDEVEELICGLLAESSRYDEAETRLCVFGDDAPAGLHSIALLVRMRSHRFERLSSLAGRAMGRGQPATSGKPLLSLTRGDQQ